MWVKTQSNGLVNLAHAASIDYNETRHELVVWWAMPLPSNENEKRPLAEIYDQNRLAYYNVEPHDWLAVLSQALPHG